MSDVNKIGNNNHIQPASPQKANVNAALQASKREISEVALGNSGDAFMPAQVGAMVKTHELNLTNRLLVVLKSPKGSAQKTKHFATTAFGINVHSQARVKT